MTGKVYSFRNEDGELVKFKVKEYLTVNQSEYVLMCPEDNASEIDIYKFSLINGNEALELIDSESEIASIKSASKILS